MARAARKISQTFNGPASWLVGGGYFKLLSTVSAVSLQLYHQGQIVLDASSVEGGFYIRTPFDRVDLATGALELVEFMASDEEGGSDRLTGTFSLSDRGGTHAPAQKTVTNASGQLLAANASRKYLLVQNQDASGNIYLRGDGTAATAGAACIKLGPGDVWEPAVPPLGEILAIGDIVNNANVHVIQA